MIECPPVTLPSSAEPFLFGLDILFGINMLINPYAIYCIIFRSPRTMSCYRWFLFWHQILSIISDVLFNFLVQPIIFVPFIMGYPRGVLKGLFPTHFMTELCIFFLSMAFVSYAHLFAFRYLAIKGFAYFPRPYVVLVIVFYILGSGPTIAIILNYGDERKVFKEMQTTYKCITPDLLKIPGFLVYDTKQNLFVVFAAFLCFCVAFVLVALLIRESIKYLKTTVMSEKALKLQKNFLRQLIIQLVVPFSVICLPMTYFAYITIFNIYGQTLVAVFLVGSVSLFSSSGAIVLICMNKNYHSFSFKKKNVVNVAKKSSTVQSTLKSPRLSVK